jgi:hypothetical protein
LIKQVSRSQQRADLGFRVSKTQATGVITGKINANPNPVPFGQRPVVISWETNDLRGAEVRVSTAPGDEKVLTKARRRGQLEITWIRGCTMYDFRLYGASGLDTLLDSVKVSLDLDSVRIALRDLEDVACGGNIDTADLSQFIATVMPCCLHSGRFVEIFPLWERHGFHVTPVHFYQPIPDTQTLPATLWDRPSELLGLDMNDSGQLDLLRKLFPKFRDEYEHIPGKPIGEGGDFHLNNRLFDGTDALVAYCMVRHFRPRSIIEIGSGFSSLILGQAMVKSGASNLTCIDPFPREFIRKGFPGLRSLIEKKVQDVDLELFAQMESDDVLFIDSSHTVKIGGDVNYLFLEVLPRLKPGVIVHVHDIFLPFDYRRDWVMEEFRFWAEQYLLQAFLTFNSEFEVLMANNYLSRFHEADLKATFPTLNSWVGGSFWMRRKPSTT